MAETHPELSAEKPMAEKPSAIAANNALQSPQNVQKKLYLKTYGCQMNVYDSGRIADVLRPLGYAEAESFEGADMVVLNTCHIREKAAEKVYSELGRIREEKERMKQHGKRMLIAVAGCVAQAEGEEMQRRAPYVDLVVGPQSYQRLPELMQNLEAALPSNVDKPAMVGAPHRRQKIGTGVVLDFVAEAKFDALPEASKPQGAAAFLTIQEGCDKFCTFCVVPYTRGAEFSRPVNDLHEEAKKLVAQGAVDITLLGQNVNAYHGQGPYGDVWNLGALMKHLSSIEGLERLRYVTSHPRDVDAEQIAMHRDIKQVMPYLHLPIQSGSNRILKAMNRKHNSDDYRRVIADFRAARPDIAFSSDFIVGYPNESDAEFEETMQLVRDIGFASAFSFIYSQRPGTPAATEEDNVPLAVKKSRLAALQALLAEQQTDFNQSMIGKVLPVLFVKDGKFEGHISGYSPYLQPVFIDAGADAKQHLNRVVNVRILEAGMRNLQGELAA